MANMFTRKPRNLGGRPTKHIVNNAKIMPNINTWFKTTKIYDKTKHCTIYETKGAKPQ